MSQSPARKPARSRGFSMIEVAIALAVLSIGVMATAALSDKMLITGQQSKYMSLASTLASEKLEELNHYSPYDPQVCVPTGTASVGSLTSTVVQSTTCPAPPPGTGTGLSGTVAYYDSVNISLSESNSDCPNGTAGCFAETVTSLNNGATSYTTTYHSADGQVTDVTSTTPPPNMTFQRNWIIEGNMPVTGTKRITVLVTLVDTNAKPMQVTFQMSTVRP